MTTTQTTADRIPELVDRIVRHCDPVRVVLFGSHARGTARPDSDVDLLVILPRVEDRTAVTIDLLRLFGDLTIPVDVLVATPEEVARDAGGTIYTAANAEGRVVYAR